MNTDIKIEEETKSANEFIFFVGTTCRLTKAEIWPEGNVPEHPTTKDVLEQMKKTCVPLYAAKLVEEWNLPVKVVVRPV